MIWLLAALMCLVLVEVVVRLPFAVPLGRLTETVGRAMYVMGRSTASDHWKEKVLRVYSGRTLGAALVLAGLMACVLALAGLLIWTIDRILPGFSSFFLGWSGILFSLCAATGYAALRRRLLGGSKAVSSGSEYSAADRMLHRIALDGPLAELSFRLEQRRVRRPEDLEERPHVFVSGLARAGTTILMRRIYATGAFSSLTYRHMPFVLAPSLGQRAAGRGKPAAASERAHGDRIKINTDSPESFDEVFWRIFDGKSYITATQLGPHDPPQDLRERFKDYVSAILRAGGAPTRYLSKNNNNILRLHALHEMFPGAVILVPFRDPVSHAGSLLRQHRNFLARQTADPFVLDYMTWLGHHEFGRGHRPFQLGPNRVEGDPETLDYWLDVWCSTYGWLEATAPDDAIFVCYEDLCRRPETWERLAERLGIDPQAGRQEEGFSLGRATADDTVLSRSKVDAARELYDRLTVRARAALEPSPAKSVSAGIN